MLRCGADIGRHVSLLRFFRRASNEDRCLRALAKAGPMYDDADFSFMMWHFQPVKMLYGVMNQAMCLAYLHSTTTTQGTLFFFVSVACCVDLS